MKILKEHKSLISILVVFIILLSLPVASSAQSTENHESDYVFDVYGFKDGNLKQIITSDTISTTSSSEWETFPTKYNVPLNKTWTVKFSSYVTLDKIDAIVIEKDNEFVPVKIYISSQDEIQVTPINEFSGNKEYQIKVFLSNGKKYKMDFTTVSEARNADIELNDNYQAANIINLNETISGNFHSNEDQDFYRIDIPNSGNLNIKAIRLDGGSVKLYLYGANGTDGDTIAYTYNSGITRELTNGLAKGTYYIRITNESREIGNYTIEVNYEENEYNDDNANPNNYINAPLLELNSTNYGHIGYTYDNNKVNNNDYYKIILEEDGTLDINVTQLDGEVLRLYLYGENGTDSNAIDYNYNWGIKNSLSYALAKGTYYLMVRSDRGYGPYKLDLTYKEQTIPNDNANSNNYIKAPLVELNSTNYGHIGYTYDNAEVNNNDYYKVMVDKDGTLDISITQLDGGKVRVYLYGENGTDGNAIDYTYEGGITRRISKNIEAGTYYVRVNNYSGYGGYELNINFN